MVLSIFQVFKIGIGPSSSHTMGPMNAAFEFAQDLLAKDLLEKVHAVQVELYGSLAYTGKGHGTDKAILMGLEGNTPALVNPDIMEKRITEIDRENRVRILGTKEILFKPIESIKFVRRKILPRHSNGMIFRAFDSEGHLLADQTSYSIGGGFVWTEGRTQNSPTASGQKIPYLYSSAKQLVELCKENNFTIADLSFANECAYQSSEEVNAKIDSIWETMQACINRGCTKEGHLPGKLKVRRRAYLAHQRLLANAGKTPPDPLETLDWVNLFALAVNEENAAGGRVVTAPTNGAAGIIPAVLRYYEEFRRLPQDPPRHREFLLTAAAIASLYTENASISGAEVGCQGEVGVACSMAAGALTAVLGGSVDQVEQAAEIGMEHNLGLTCDPIGGLVQIPCIERNAMGSIKAINAARLALQGDGKHHVSLDDVIKTMRQTGADMLTKYKETSRGGLAVNVTEC